MTLQSFDGATNPMQGWYSSSYGFKQPSWALQFTRDGTNAALPRFSRPAPTPRRALWSRKPQVRKRT